MAVELFSILLGFVLGGIAVAVIWNLSQRTVRNPERTRLTALWSLNDITEPGMRPTIIAEGVRDLRIPAGSKVVVPDGTIDAVPAEILASCEVRMHPEVRINAAVGKDRALVFSGHVTPKAFAVFTMDEAAVHLLQSDFQRMWNEATPYVERVDSISDLAGKAGHFVEITGKAVDLMEFRGRKMLRLTDGKTNVGVVAAQGTDVSSFQGSTVRVVGQFRREQGYAYLAADKVMPVSA